MTQNQDYLKKSYYIYETFVKPPFLSDFFVPGNRDLHCVPADSNISSQNT